MARVAPMKTPAQAAANFAANGGAPSAATNWATNLSSNLPAVFAAAAAAVGLWQANVSTAEAATAYKSGLVACGLEHRADCRQDSGCIESHLYGTGEGGRWAWRQLYEFRKRVDAGRGDGDGEPQPDQPARHL